MASIFWNSKEVLFVKFIIPSTTINDGKLSKNSKKNLKTTFKNEKLGKSLARI